MAKTFNLEIVTPTKVLDEGQVEYLRAPSTDGLFGVMKGHTKSMIALDIGEIKITKNGTDHFLSTSGGYAEITGDSVQILAETVEKSEEIDADRAKESAERAEKRMKDTQMDRIRSRLALERAKNRLRVSKR